MMIFILLYTMTQHFHFGLNYIPRNTYICFVPFRWEETIDYLNILRV